MVASAAVGHGQPLGTLPGRKRQRPEGIWKVHFFGIDSAFIRSLDDAYVRAIMTESDIIRDPSHPQRPELPAPAVTGLLRRRGCPEVAEETRFPHGYEETAAE